MLTLVMKRQLTEQDKKDIEDCFIKLTRNEVKFDDGIKFKVTKEDYIPEEQDTPSIIVNISEYFNNINVANYTYDYGYYMNIITPLIRSGIGLPHPTGCDCNNCKSVHKQINVLSKKEGK